MDLLLIDEAQVLYHNDHDPLWGKLKLLTQGPQPGQPRPTLRIIMAAMYGSHPSGIGQPSSSNALPATPFAFHPDMVVSLKPPGTEGVGLNLEFDTDFSELIANFNKLYEKFGGLDEEDLLEHLFNMTSGQVINW